MEKFHLGLGILRRPGNVLFSSPHPPGHGDGKENAAKNHHQLILDENQKWARNYLER